MIFRSLWLPVAKSRIVALWQYTLGFRALWALLLLLTGIVHADAVVVPDANSPSASNEHAIINDLEITRRVLGGDEAEYGDWPSMVAIATAGYFPLQDRFFCGGTLVAERYVLTAAHCLFDAYGRQENASNLRVVASIYDLSDEEGVVETDVTNVIIHPDYDNSLDSPPNDVALLELSNVVDAPIGQLFAGESEDYTDTLGFILGWGATRYINDLAAEYPTVLQEARVPLVALDTCNAPISYDGLVDVAQMCAGFSSGEVDTCAGDSGGPLYILENGQPVQIGITSFGNGCAQPNFYGIYSNVSHYIPWLGNYISVPEQADELIARRLAGETPESISKGIDGDTRSSAGALNPILMVLLTITVALRLSACSAQTMESTRMTSQQARLGLSVQDQRAGLTSVRLGMDRAAVAQALQTSLWQAPECTSGKTAVRGTGRLFMTEQCVVLARGPVWIASRAVSQMSYVLIGQKLARLDVTLTAAPSVVDPDLWLLDELNARYRVDLDSGLWQHVQDEIHYLPAKGLRFIDGRFRESLPALFDEQPRFE